MIDRFLTFFYLPGEETLFRNVRKLAPGAYLLHRNGRTEVHQYWDLEFSKPAERLSSKEAEKQLVNLLADAVESHMIADVPVGILLSGGLDSTAVLSFAAERTQKEISTFTVGFSEPGVVDERPYARLAAETYGARHYDMTVSASDFASFMPSYVWHMEEPVCEPPALALYYVSKMARDHVKVLLSGEGGDEAFAGYPEYRNLLWFERLKRSISPFKGVAARGFAALGSLFRSARVARYAALMNARFPDYYYSRTSTSYRNSASGFRTLYRPEFASSIDPEHTVEPLRRLHSHIRGHSTLDQMLYVDTKTWLPDDLLIKADKITMANSVELRVPLLDHRVLEFAASLPDDFKVRGFKTKYLAKKSLGRRVPERILRRRKAGFPVPYALWLQADLKGWLQDILLDRQTLARGYFEKASIERLIANHQRHGDSSKGLFSLAVLELWHREFIGKGGVALRAGRSASPAVR
jgi:asparagine synthase (glutamine-hydrolysing)